MYNGMMCQTLLDVISALMWTRYICRLCWWGMRTCLCSHAPLILCRLLCEQHVCIGLGRAVWIWVIEQVLDAKQYLVYSDRRTPAFLLIEDAQTYCS